MQLIALAKEKGYVGYPGDGTNLWNAVHIRDVAEAIGTLPAPACSPTWTTATISRQVDGTGPSRGRSVPSDGDLGQAPARASARRSVDAFDDAEVAFDAVGEGGEGLLVGGALVGGHGLLEGVELDQDSALGDSGVVGDGAAAADDGAAARGADGGAGQLVVGGELLGVGDGAVGAGRCASCGS